MTAFGAVLGRREAGKVALASGGTAIDQGTAGRLRLAFGEELAVKIGIAFGEQLAVRIRIAFMGAVAAKLGLESAATEEASCFLFPSALHYTHRPSSLSPLKAHPYSIWQPVPDYSADTR